MAATNQQVQNFSDQRIRPVCQKIRALKLELDDLIASIDDVYANLTDSPDWTDGRTDGPPNLLTPNDLLAINSAANNIRNAIRDDANYGVVVSACVTPVSL